jgi:hypothetical protein
MVYDIGDLARLSVAFTDTAGNSADPSSVSLTIQAPDNTQSTPAPVHDGTGVWHYDLPITQSGVWFYRYTGTGLVTAVEEGYITVRPTLLTPQPTANPPIWTYAHLIKITEAIGNGVKIVRFQDRTVEYASIEEMLLIKGLIEAYLGVGAAGGMRRQIRMVTSKGL